MEAISSEVVLMMILPGFIPGKSLGGTLPPCFALNDDVIRLTSTIKIIWLTMKIISKGIKNGHLVVYAYVGGMFVGGIIDLITDMFPTFLGFGGLISVLSCYFILKSKNRKARE